MASIAMPLMMSLPASLRAQRGGNSPVAPSSVIGPATSSPTISVLGMAAVEGASPIAQRSEVWMGATQPLGRLGNVRFAAIGSGNVRPRDGVGSNSAAEGTLALRARARFSGAQLWSAVSYGYANVNGDLSGQGLVRAPVFAVGMDGVRGVDTTVSRRVDVGAINRAEAGVISNVSGMEFSLGFSVERTSRVTTQTLTLDEPDPSMMTLPFAGRVVTTRTTRSLQRREIATGIASLGFETGPTMWLVSVTAPVASWITSDALAPKPRIAPTIASVALVQPINAWLSVVGAASTNSSSVSNTAFRDDLGPGRNGAFAPVIALGVRIARLPFFGHGDDTPSGILSFESRTIGAVDSAALEATSTLAIERSDVADAADSDTLRVVLLIDAPKAESVEIMGDATQWTVTQMSRNRSGRWRAELKLAPGVHRISVRADGGKWIAPPNLPIGNDDFGSPVGMIIVRGQR